MYSPVFDEVTTALVNEDDQLNEEHTTTSESGNSADYRRDFDAILRTLQDHYVKNQKPRKKRTVKFDPSKAVKKVNYMKSCDELGISSIDPKKIIGAKKLVIFNTKYRYLQVFEASGHDGLMVKGTTIQNFDKDRSLMKTLRDPKSVLSKINNIRSFNNTWSSIKTKERKVSSGSTLVNTRSLFKHIMILIDFSQVILSSLFSQLSKATRSMKTWFDTSSKFHSELSQPVQVQVW